MKYKLLRFSLLSILAMLWGGFVPLWAAETTGTITFGNNGVKINSSSVTGNDSQGNTWTITTVGTSSFTPNANYSQVGSSGSPATSITFTTTLSKSVNVKSFSATFGGFSGTAGSVSLKVGDAEIGTGNLNASTDVTVSSTISGTGTVLTVSVTGISKGVKCYNISYTYDDPLPETTLTLGDHQNLVYIDQYVDLPTATVVADGTPISGAEVTWSSSNEDVAKIEGQKIKGLAEGTTTIKAVYAGNATYASSVATYELTVEESPIIANPYTYTFEKQIFTENNQTQKLKAVNWTVVSNSEYWGYDGSKGQQFGSGNKPATTLTLTTFDIPGTITSVKINTCGASSIAATVGVTVGGTSLNYESETTASLTASATSYEFTGSASGDIVISYTQTSSKAIYIKSIEVEYTNEEEPAGFRDIKIDLTNGNLLEESEKVQWGDINAFGIAVAEDGTVSRVAADAANAACTISGKWHSASCWASLNVTVNVEGPVKITCGTQPWSDSPVTVKNGSETIASFSNNGSLWSSTATGNVVTGYYKGTEATTLTIDGGGYPTYFAVEAVDPAEIPNEATLTFDVAEAGAEGTAPAAQKVEVGKTVTIPANTTLYKEGYTLTAWTNGSTQYKADDDVPVNADMTLTPVFTENTVSLADREEAVTVTWQFGPGNGAGTINGSGIFVTQATVGSEAIDVKMDIDASNGKFENVGRTDKWAQVNGGTKVTVPSCKGATVELENYSVPTGTTIDGQTATIDETAKTASATITSTSETIDVVAGNVSNSYWSYLTVVLPVVQGDEPGDENVLYSWDAGTEKGGTAFASNGTEVGAANGPYSSVIILSGKSDFSTNTVTLTLENELKAGDEIAITAYRNKNVANKQSGALLKFDKGGTATTATTGLEFVNIDSSDASAEDSNRGTEPNTITLTVPEDADGSTVITMTRAKTQTNLFITELVIIRPTSDEPSDEPEVVNYDNLTATWDFENDCAGLNTSSAALTSIDSDVDGISLTLAGGTTRDNGNSYQFANGLTMQIPVKTNKDIITVIGYPGYTDYTIGSDEGTGSSPDVTHKVTSAEAEQGYAILTAGNNCYIKSITVVQNSGYEEKMLYSTDFSDWNTFAAATSATTVKKTTKYTNEALDFGIYNTAVMDVTDTKFSAHLPHKALQAAKAADPYVTTSKLASITKVRFIHGATGNDRGWKLEAKGDGDDDWVVISDATANPAAWSEVTAEVNRQNVQLRWTNLTNNQNAYMFELDIYGMVDMSSAPILGTFKANDVEYVAGDIFEQNNNGDYEATIEISKKETMISEANPLTDIVADNGEAGTVTYQTTGEGNGQTTVVTIPVTIKGETANYIATFKFKADYTLTYYAQDGTTVIGTQTVEKDATIGQFAYGEANITVGEGMKFRGWGANTQASANRKFATDDVITANASLYAIVTEIETESSSARYDFNLTDQYFYAEDHEAFNPAGNGKWHDAQHGWVFSAGDKIDILVGGNANIILGCCAYSGGNAITLTNGSGETVGTISNDKVSSDGQKQLIEYKGEAGTLTINFGGTSYLHNLTIMNVTEPTFETDGDWFFVEAGDANSLLNAIDVANAANGATDASRKYIFLSNGTYDLGTACLTQVSGNNISIIGESQKGVTIKNSPTAEGIGVTATLFITGKETYLQDLTIQNAWDYYGGIDSGAGAGRAVCIQDKGTNTICKNVTLLSYQDTYYTNNADGNFYWETSDIHGTVDFICGEGTLFMENSTLTVEKRNSNGSGGCTLTAPSTKAGNSYGYVFNNCTIQNYAENYNFGRAWNNEPRCAYINTTVNDNKLVDSRWTAQGMNNGVYAKKFVEYNTKDADGNVVSPSNKSIKFYDKANAVSETYETILTTGEAAEYAVSKVFTNWTPATYAAQLDAPAATYDNGQVSWTPANNGAIAYLIEKNGKFVGITTESPFEVEAGAGDVLTIRAANGRGGFGEAKTVEVNSITVTLNSAGYATLASSKALDFSGMAGLTAYIVADTKDSKATLTSVNVAPAGTGLVLKGTAGTVYSIPVATTAADDVSANMLEAAVTAATVEANTVYVLTGDKLMKFADTQIPAGKAYLPKDKTGSARLLELVFDDATGIATVDVDVPVDAPAYDLQGRRVKTVKKGVYVVDGKKVIIK